MKIINCYYETHGEVILEIFNDAILNTTALYEYEPRNREFIKSWFDDKKNRQHPIIGAINDHDELMGFATFGLFRPHPAFKTTIEHSVYVHQAHRGQGAAKLLLTQLIKLADMEGYHVMIGAIDGQNIASINLHEQLGFEKNGHLYQVGFKFNQWLDLVFYQKQLKNK